MGGQGLGEDDLGWGLLEDLSCIVLGMRSSCLSGEPGCKEQFILASPGMTSASEGILPSWTFLKNDKPRSVCSIGTSFPLFYLAGIAMSGEVRECKT